MPSNIAPRSSALYFLGLQKRADHRSSYKAESDHRSSHKAESEPARASIKDHKNPDGELLKKFQASRYKLAKQFYEDALLDPQKGKQLQRLKTMGNIEKHIGEALAHAIQEVITSKASNPQNEASSSQQLVL